MAKILVIDDSSLMRQTLELILKRANYTVIEAPDGPTGIALARDEKPDLILLDMMMPHMSGEEVAVCLQQDPELSSIPIVVITASRQTELVISMLSLNVRDYLLKPIELSTLHHRIEAVLARQEANSSNLEKQ